MWKLHKFRSRERRMKLILVAAATLGCLTSATTARATPIEYQFTMTALGGGAESGTFFFGNWPGQ
jgi:hypothetical protein